MIHFLIFVLLVFTGIPVLMFILECLLGLKLPVGLSLKDPLKQPLPKLPEELTTAILMPAHNEASVIEETLEKLKPHLSSQDQVVVVADNCSDNTAELVRKFGFTAIERSSETERGKGYALDYGLRYLKQQDAGPPDIVVIVDADCLLADNALLWLKHSVLKYQRPAQAKYLMLRGEVDRIAVKVSEFAFKVKNEIRLRGLHALHLPVPLTGTGMAFPWEALAEAQLATGDIVEDMRLGVELAESGRGARYCDEAMVYSYFPTSEAAEKTQRERWEHGHLNTLRQYVPRLLKSSIKHKQIAAFGMMLDLLIPPLSLFVMLIAALSAGLFVLAIFIGGWAYVALAWCYLFGIVATVILVWHMHGRHILSAQECLHIPVYAISKIVVYVAYMVRKQTKWIRTERD